MHVAYRIIPLQAMTPIGDVFMLSIDSKLDYDLLKKICQTGHSRVPVYEEVDVPVSSLGGNKHDANAKQRTEKMKKILGILLVKQCVLLDPEGKIFLSILQNSHSIYVWRCNPAPSDPLE